MHTVYCIFQSFLILLALFNIILIHLIIYYLYHVCIMLSVFARIDQKTTGLNVWHLLVQ